MSRVTRGGVKDVRPLVKELREHGFRVVHHAGQLLVLNEEGLTVKELPLRIHDFRTLKNVRAELRRDGLLPKPEKRHSLRRQQGRRASEATHERPTAETVETSPARHDQFDWLRRPTDADRSRILRERLRDVLAAHGGTGSRNRRQFAKAALRYADRTSMRTFSGEQPQLAAEGALRHLLVREGALSIWTLKLFSATCQELEERLASITEERQRRQLAA